MQDEFITWQRSEDEEMETKCIIPKNNIENASVLSKSPDRQYFHKLKVFLKSNEIQTELNSSCTSFVPGIFFINVNE